MTTTEKEMLTNKILIILNQSDKPLNAFEIATKCDTTTQKTAAILRQLRLTNQVYTIVKDNRNYYIHINKHQDKIAKKIYGYEFLKHYKYIVCFENLSYNIPYTADYGTNNKRKAILYALKEHLKDKLTYVVIENERGEN